MHIAVSYTHLDVYKRQAIEGPVLSVFRHANGIIEELGDTLCSCWVTAGDHSLVDFTFADLDTRKFNFFCHVMLPSII